MSQDLLIPHSKLHTSHLNHFLSPIKTEATAEIKKLPAKRKNYIFIKSGLEFVKVFFDDILFIKAGGSYATIQTKNKTYTASTNMKSVLSQFKWASLRRCHRSFAINIDNIESYNDKSVNFGKEDTSFTIPVSGSHKHDIFDSLPRLTCE